MPGRCENPRRISAPRASEERARSFKVPRSLAGDRTPVAQSTREVSMSRQPLAAVAVVLTMGCGSSVTTTPGASPTPAPPGQNSVVQEHDTADRNGAYIQPSLSRAAAATLHADPAFQGVFQGNVYGQPLYVENGPGGKGVFIVATENDTVFALDEKTGGVVWAATVGQPAGQTGAGCGDISPLGITGTPYIDLASRTLFLDAVVGTSVGITTHQVHALSIDSGAEQMGGWPLDVSAVSFNGLAFNPVVQNQRGALAALGNTLYVPYGGHAGDCGSYHGWVVAVPFGSPQGAQAWATPAAGGGIWGPGGLSSDGQSIFAATGNTFGASQWGGGEAMIRLQAGALFSGQPADFFAPSNWVDLDNQDLDEGGSGALLVNAPSSNPPALGVLLGKNGVGYLLNRSSLGGIGQGNGIVGEGLFSGLVDSGEIIGVPAASQTGRGPIVVFHGTSGAACPGGSQGDLIALQIVPGSPPTFETAWCADNQGQGSPIITTVDGQAEAIVWTAGAEGSERLHGYDAQTGALVFAGGGNSEALANVRRFTTPIAVKGRILVAGDGQLFAFTTQ
jgi:hypothetical protein